MRRFLAVICCQCMRRCIARLQLAIVISVAHDRAQCCGPIFAPGAEEVLNSMPVARSRPSPCGLPVRSVALTSVGWYCAAPAPRGSFLQVSLIGFAGGPIPPASPESAVTVTARCPQPRPRPEKSQRIGFGPGLDIFARNGRSSFVDR